MCRACSLRNNAKAEHNNLVTGDSSRTSRAHTSRTALAFGSSTPLVDSLTVINVNETLTNQATTLITIRDLVLHLICERSLLIPDVWWT